MVFRKNHWYTKWQVDKMTGGPNASFAKLSVDKFTVWQKLIDKMTGRLWYAWPNDHFINLPVQILTSWWKWQFDKMTGWQNGRLTKWQVDKMTGWQNDRLKKWQVDKMTGWQNDLAPNLPIFCHNFQIKDQESKCLAESLANPKEQFLSQLDFSF